ncbi:MAG: efflux RND transporter periplasmic adaptor subunit [Patescibacteria group bacterium]
MIKVLSGYTVWIVVLLVLAGGGYYYWQSIASKTEIVNYEVEVAARNTVVVTVSGSGQVLPSNEVEVISEVSGELLTVEIQATTVVKKGDVLVTIDSAEAEKAVKDAQNDLETAQLELEKLYDPVDDYELQQAENSVAEAQRSLDDLVQPASDSDVEVALNDLAKAKNDLAQMKLQYENDVKSANSKINTANQELDNAHDDIFSKITNAYANMPTAIDDLYDAYYGTSIAKSEVAISDYRHNAELLKSMVVDNGYMSEINKYDEEARVNYKIANDLYDEWFDQYTGASVYDSNEEMASLLDQTIECERALSESAKSQLDMYNYWIDYRNFKRETIYDEVKNIRDQLNAYNSSINNDLSSLTAMQSTLDDKVNNITELEDDRSYLESNYPLNLADAELSVQEKEDSLNDLLDGGNKDEIAKAKENLGEKQMYLAKIQAAPDSLDVRAKNLVISQKQDALLEALSTLADYTITAPIDGVVAELNVDQGQKVSNSTVVATIITEKKIAQLVLNEADIVQVELGQKVNVDVDAIDGLTLVGEVVEIDELSEASSGVVTYNIKVVFLTEDERVKEGMSVSGSVIIDTASDVLAVPVAAVTKQDDLYYVQILNNGVAEWQEIEVGLADDFYYEVVSGLAEGQEVITGESSDSTADTSSTSTQSSIIQGIGGGGPMSGGGPMMR